MCVILDKPLVTLDKP